MKLSAKALDRVRDSRTLPQKLRRYLDVSRATMWRYIKDNDPVLTQAGCLELIRKATELPDAELLESEKEEEATA